MSVYERKSRLSRESVASVPASRSNLYSRFSATPTAARSDNSSLESRIKNVYPTVNAGRASAMPRYPASNDYDDQEDQYDVPSTQPSKLSGGYSRPSVSSAYNTASPAARAIPVPAPNAAPGNDAASLTAGSVASALTQMSNKGYSAGAPNFGVAMRHLYNPAPWVDINRLPMALKNGIMYNSYMRFPRLPKTHERYLPAQLPEDRGKPTLVLDMDETLMHCSAERLVGPAPDLIVRFDDCSSVGYVYIRPYAKVFLENTAKLFELVIFTASTQPYADQVLAKLDPTRRLIRHRLYRPQCSEIGGGYTKDLRLLNRDLTKTMLVDNSPISLALQLDNGILCESYFGNNPQDTELVETLQLLQEWLESKQAIYRFLAEKYGLRSWINSMRMKDPIPNMIN